MKNNMHLLRNKISPLLVAIAFFQSTAPILNVAAELQWCHNQEMQCCQTEFPARIVCCAGEPAYGIDESAPSQMALQKHGVAETKLATDLT